MLNHDEVISILCKPLVEGSLHVEEVIENTSKEIVISS